MYEPSTKMYRKLVWLTVLLVVCDASVLIRKGWYKTHKKGPKVVLNNVEYIDTAAVPDTNYLRIHGKINTLHRSRVRNLRKLTVLKLAFCEIRDIVPGAFENLPNLATLALLDNSIEHIKTGVFNNLSVSVLFVQRNQISSIDADAFNDMPNLYRLKLNSNRIAIWNSNWFKSTPRLTEIFFRRNELQKIPRGAFRHIKGSHQFNGTYAVDTKIYLSKNSISSIDADAFEGLAEFSQLWLDRNKISEIDNKVFSHLRQIGVIFLSKNKLKALPNDMFPNLSTDLLTLDLAGNNNLTCLSYELVSKTKITNLQDIRNLECKCVVKLMEKLAENKKNNEIKTDCQDDDE